MSDYHKSRPWQAGLVPKEVPRTLAQEAANAFFIPNMATLPGKLITPPQVPTLIDRGIFSVSKFRIPFLTDKYRKRGKVAVEWRAMKYSKNESIKHRELKLSVAMHLRKSGIENVVYEPTCFVGRADVGSRSAGIYAECGRVQAAKLQSVFVGETLMVLPYHGTDDSFYMAHDPMMCTVFEFKATDKGLRWWKENEATELAALNERIRAHWGWNQIPPSVNEMRRS